VCGSRGSTDGASKCSTQTVQSRRAAIGLGLGSLFAAGSAIAAPSPTNLDDMEARKALRDEMLKAARAKAAAQAASEAKAAAPAL
jgi:hypothetical protein